MTRFRVGVADPILAARPAPDTFTRANYLGAVANRVDSFWVPDHLNQLFPRSLWKQKYCGATKLLPTLSHLAKVPPSLMREYVLNGTPDEIIEQAAQWRDSGVRYLVLVNASVLQRSLRKGLASTVPFNKIVRRLKKL